MNQPDSRVTVRPLSIGLYLDPRAPHARNGEVHALAAALGDLGHRVIVHSVRYQGEEPGLDHPLWVQRAAQGAPADRVLRADLNALVKGIKELSTHHDLHHAFDALTAQALLLARPDDLVLRTVTNLARGATSYHEHMSAHTVRAARQVLAPTEALCTELSTRYGVQPIHVDTGVDVEAFAMAKAGDVVGLGVDLQLDGAGPILFTFGGLPHGKESTNLLHAFAALHARYTGARWIVEGALPEQLDDAVRSTFLAELAALPEPVRAAVRLTRTFEAHERASAYQLADLVACLGAREAHLSWLLEAQAASVPLLLNDEPGLREYVDERCACWCDATNAAQLAIKLGRAALHGRTDRRLVYAAHERAREFTWTRSATQHAYAYRRALFGGEASLRTHVKRAAAG